MPESREQSSSTGKKLDEADICAKASRNMVNQKSGFLQFIQTGAPAEVVEFAQRDVNEPQGHDVLVRMLFAPVNPADLNFIEGTYGRAAVPPCIPGHEGCGEVARVGPDVKSLKVGDLIRLMAQPASDTAFSIASALRQAMARLGKMLATSRREILMPCWTFVPRRGAHLGDGLNAEEQRQGGGVAEFAVGDVLDVAQAAFEVLGAGLQPLAPLGLDFVGLAGQVAAAVAGVLADVAEDVDELQALCPCGRPIPASARW
jgi:hypothetical protein